MWPNMMNYSQKKLRLLNILFNILYFLLVFVAPLITVIVSFYDIGAVSTKKVSMISIFIAVCIIFASTKFLRKQIDKISIYKLDGTYNNGMRTFKHLAQMASHLIVPITVLAISVVFCTVFEEYLDFYVKMIITCVSFYLAGLLVDGFAIKFLDDELSIREKVKESNAVGLRQKNLTPASDAPKAE